MARSTVENTLLRLKWRRAFERWETKLARWVDAAKAGYDPNQPRAPAGSADGGQWSGGGSGDGEILSDANPDSFWKPGTRLAQAGSKKPKRQGNRPNLKVPLSPGKDKIKGPLEAPPKIPLRKPGTIKERNQLAKNLAKWLRKASTMRAKGRIGLALRGIRGAIWLYDHYPFIQSNLDAPKSLDQLNKEVKNPGKGYEIHHIVEQTSAEQDGFQRDQIDAPENLARVPTLRHREITTHFQTKNPMYENKSPRNYLRGKSWEERRKLGLEALTEFGVLGP